MQFHVSVTDIVYLERLLFLIVFFSDLCLKYFSHFFLKLRVVHFYLPYSPAQLLSVVWVFRAHVCGIFSEVQLGL